MAMGDEENRSSSSTHYRRNVQLVELSLENISYAPVNIAQKRKGRKTILSNVSATVSPYKLSAWMGPSGSGKVMLSNKSHESTISRCTLYHLNCNQLVQSFFALFNIMPSSNCSRRVFYLAVLGYLQTPRTIWAKIHVFASTVKGGRFQRDWSALFIRMIYYSVIWQWKKRLDSQLSLKVQKVIR